MELPNRKNPRLSSYDYSQNGAYFVTICSYNKRNIFGDIVVGQGLCSCRLSNIGKTIDNEIKGLESRFEDILVDKYVIMPNHIHILIIIQHPPDFQRTELCSFPTNLSNIICALKSISTKKTNIRDNTPGRKIWQYRFHDRIIRNEEEYFKIWEYIDCNPLKWELDCFYTSDY